ncbi:MAG: glycosyltransferase family 39 protein [Acidobacteria bacterium]|nr:glycosyltransferase family 39 protein [Acidobacteriota bacterium]
MVQDGPMGSAGGVAPGKAAAATGSESLWPWRDAEPERRAPWAVLAGLMALAAALRAIALNQQLWYDEITTLLDFVRTPLGHILTTYTSQNQHMLYSVLARMAVVLFGDYPWTLRLPAAAFGVAAVPALYYCARLLTTRREALLACVLLTVSYHHVWFSQNARGYTGLAFFTLVTTYFFIRGARGAEGAGLPDRKRRDAESAKPGAADGRAAARPYGNWVWYAVALALGMYTHLTMGFVAAGHGLVYVWLVAAPFGFASLGFARDRRGKRAREARRLPGNAFAPLAGFVLAGVITAALYAPVVGDLARRTLGKEVNVGAVSEAVRAEWKNPLWLVVETVRGLGAGSAVAGFAAVTLGGLIVLAGLWSFLQQNRYAVGLMVAPGLVTGAVMMALGHNLWPRFFFFGIGFGMLLIVRGAMVWADAAARMMKREVATGVKWGTATVAMLLLASCFQLRAAYLYPKQDFAGAMTYVDAHQQPGDVVVLVGLTTIPYQRYYGRDWPSVETPTQLAARRTPGHATWVLYTIPIYVQSRYPELWNILRSEFTTVKIFRGTMGGGEVYVCKAEKQ